MLFVGCRHECMPRHAIRMDGSMAVVLICKTLALVSAIQVRTIWDVCLEGEFKACLKGIPAPVWRDRLAGQLLGLRGNAAIQRKKGMCHYSFMLFKVIFPVYSRALA